MEVANILKIKLTPDECETITKANVILENLGNVLSNYPKYDYSRMVFNETHAKFDEIIMSATISDSGNLCIACTPAPKQPIDDKYVTKLAKKVYSFAEDTCNLYDEGREDKPTLKEFKKSFYSYKQVAYLMEATLQGMDQSGDDLPRYYDILMELVHHMEWNDLDN